MACSESVVTNFRRVQNYCGACRSFEQTKIYHELEILQITVDDFQDLVDRGWLRYGYYLIKVLPKVTCCPAYGLRLRAVDFVPSKNLIRVNNKMQRFLDGTLEKSNELMNDSTNKSKKSCNANWITHVLSNEIENAVKECIVKGEFPDDMEVPEAHVKKVLPCKTKTKLEDLKNVLYTTNIAFRINSCIRQQVESIDKKYSPSSIADMLASCLTPFVAENPISLLIKACNGHINFYSATESDYLLDHDQKVDDQKKKNNEYPDQEKISHKLEMLLKKSTFDPEEYALYKKYQIKIHNFSPDNVTERMYMECYVESPLIHVPPPNEDDDDDDGTTKVPFCGFGSFHQQYLINGKLVAVDVVDILPNSYNSLYFFYDPDFAFLSLGKYSVMKGIEWIKENQVYCSSLEYYCLGSYIPSCMKMRYKVEYYPTQVLCPFYYQWVPYDDVSQPFLDIFPYVVLSDLVVLPNKQLSSTYDPYYEEENIQLGKILVGVNGSVMKYKDVCDTYTNEERSNLDAQLLCYMRHVGPKLSKRMIFAISGLSERQV